MPKVSLKTQNAPIVILFLVWIVSVYILFILGFKDFWRELTTLFSKVNAKNGMFVIIAPLLSFILSELLGPNFKAILVSWRIKNPLPGSRAFAEIGPKDPRIDMNKVEKKLGKIPTDPAEQNRVWYKIYKEVQGSTSVDLAHKNYLLARDLTSIDLIFLLFTPWILIYLHNGLKMFIIYSLILLIQYCVLSIVGQNAGKRFVSNVLAEYSCK